MAISAHSLKALPEWLWYEKSSTTREWTPAPLGHPYASRLVQGRSDCYVKPLAGAINEKRKLILTDWTAEQWDTEKCAEVKDFLLYLVQEGFEIFVWQNDHEESFVKLSTENLQSGLLENMDFRQNISPILPQELIKLAAKAKGISSDEIGFLNGVRIKELLGHDGIIDGPEYYVLAGEIQKSSFAISNLVKQIKAEHEGKMFVEKMNAPLLDEFVQSLLEKPYELQIVHKSPVKIFDLKISRGNIDVDACRSLRLDYVSNPSDVQWLQSFFKKNHCLRELDVINYSGGGLENIDEQSLDDLKHLSLMAITKAHEKAVEKILIFGKNIKHLTCFSCSGEHVKFDIENNMLKNQALKKLKSLSCPQLQTCFTEELTFLLGQAKKVEKLTLSFNPSTEPQPHYIPGDACKHVKSLSIEQLESIGLLSDELWWENIEVVTSVLKDILEKSTALENLSLSVCPLPSDVNMPSLKSLMLKNSSISSEILQDIISKSPYLEVLQLSSMHVSTNKILEFKRSLVHLKELQVTTSVIDNRFLNTILKKAPNLRLLNILGARSLGGAHINLDKDFELNNLRVLAIDTSQLPLLMQQNITKLRINKLKLMAAIKILIRKELTLGEVHDQVQNTLNDNFPIEFLERLQTFVPRPDKVFTKDKVDYVLSHAKNLDRLSISSLTGELGVVSNPSRNEARGDITVNMNTKLDPNKQYHVTKVFWGIQSEDPHPAHYRISACDTVEIGSKIKLTNKSKKKNERTLELIDPKHSPYFCEQDTFDFSDQVPLAGDERCFYGKTSIALSSEWQPLPSLSTLEQITHLHVPGVNKEDIEFQYSLRDRLYYIRVKNQPAGATSKEIPIDFLLKTHWPIDRSGQRCSPELKKLIQKYKKNLGEKGLPQDATDDSSDYKTDAEILRALQDQTLVGACVHRTLAFKAEVNQLIDFFELPPNIRVRAIENDIHAYIEVEEETEEELKGLRESICIDLGGHPAGLNISNANAPSGRSNAPEGTALPANTSAVESLPESKEQTELKKLANSHFITWVPKISKAVNLKMYAQHILTGFSEHELGREVKNSLVGLHSKEEMENFRLYIQAECARYKDKEVYYIDSPEDLMCSGNWIERVGDKGIPRGGPGGPLHAFLRRADFSGENKKTPILIVNWANFKPKEIIQFNALYDTKERRADGTLLPEHTRVIGLFNPNNSQAYKGDDFFRRWYSNELSQELREALSRKEKIKALKKFFVEKSIEFQKRETVVIDLYESSDWKEMLLGQWFFKGKELVFQEGKLKAALAKAKAEHKPLEIKNGLWDNEAFRTFWQQEKLAGRLDGIECIDSKGYDWSHLCQRQDPQAVTWDRVSAPPEGNDLYVINPTVFSKFFYDYTFKPNELGMQQQGVQGDLFKTPGWLQKSKYLSLYVTRDLSVHQWAELLETAKSLAISLDIRLAPNVVLLTDLEMLSKKEHKEETETVSVRVHVREASTAKSQIVITPDINFTVSKLQKQYVGCKTINISELESQDLLENVHPKMQGLEYTFFRTENALFTALKAGETVILKGTFKPEWVDVLSSLCIPGAHIWMNGKRIVLPGKLLLVSEENQAFGFVSVIKENEKEILEYKAKLIKNIEAEQKTKYEDLSTRSVVQLESMLRYVQVTGHDPITNWGGLISIKEGREISLKREKEFLSVNDLSLETSENFKKERYTQIDEVLRGKRNHPFVFIAGSTGVGKSSFMQKELKKIAGSPYKVYIGLENIQKWANNTKKADFPILFIDEANIDAGDFSNYEGLFDKPPHMIINGEYVFLSDKHKVVFAGNPLSYGSRKMPALFNDYGGSVVFPPMSPAYVYHQVLKPILNANLGTEHARKKLPEEVQQKIGLKILSIYQHIVNVSEDKILISPRELQMMALFMVDTYKNTGELSEQTMAKIIKTLAEPLVPEKHKSDFETFCKQALGVVEKVLHQTDRLIPKTASTDAFLVTASRRSIDDEISEFLSLRQLKRTTQEDALKYAAGLGGIVLEGDPGLGKSEFVINLLVEKGFQEKHFSSEAQKTEPVITRDTSKNFFYRMPVSMQESDKTKLLLQAFHEGSIVVIDELNSSPMIENLLNALLMGYDLEGKKPVNPGFGIIATQNPISMAGREAASSALEHRFIKRYFLPYSVDEMEAILQQRGLSAEDAQELVEEYNYASNYARKYHKEPAPTFGHLMEAAKLKLEAQAREKEAAFFEAEARIAAARAEAQAVQTMQETPAILHTKKVTDTHKKTPPPPPPLSKSTPST